VNLSWTVDAEDIKQVIGVDKVALINDLEPMLMVLHACMMMMLLREIILASCFHLYECIQIIIMQACKTIALLRDQLSGNFITPITCLISSASTVQERFTIDALLLITAPATPRQILCGFHHELHS